MAFTYLVAISVSDTAPTTGLRILASTWIGAFKNFCCCNSGFMLFRVLPRKQKPLTLLLNFDTDKYEVLETTYSCIPDL